MRRDELKVRYFILPTVIVAFMIMTGIWIHNKMEDSRLANNTMYETAIPADDKDSYDYILDTQQGIFYTHGLFTAEQPVEFSEIDGEYAELKRREEHYVMKTRVVTYTDSEGNTHTKTETYWEWEHYHTDYLSTKTIMFNDHSYDYDKFSGFPESHITTRHPRSDVRVKYYGVPVKMELTQHYAVMNRNAIVDTILKGMGWEEIDRFDSIHNYIDIENNTIRKGATDARKGLRLVIPLNMKEGSIIGVGKGNKDWNESAPHGAGRVLSRSKAKEVLSLEDFKDTMQGIYTTSVVQSTLDEAPKAYKDAEEIKEIITDTVDIDRIVKPVYNFKAK